jgi:hypothetical protein
LNRELTSARFKKHGMKRSREYNSWRNMKQRCTNPRNKDYENYGGRGISFCEDWCPFVGFFADTATCPPGCSLDRIDVNGNYGPGNWRWADAKQQRRNQRRARAAVKRRQVKPPPLDDPPF